MIESWESDANADSGARPRRASPRHTLDNHLSKQSLGPLGTKPPFCTICTLCTYGMYTYLRAHLSHILLSATRSAQHAFQVFRPTRHPPCEGAFAFCIFHCQVTSLGYVPGPLLGLLARLIGTRLRPTGGYVRSVTAITARD